MSERIKRLTSCIRGPKPPDIMSDDRIFLAWQRSHMANERTFLAWSRTSISLLAFGFVIERFDIFLKHLLQLGGQTTSYHGFSPRHLSQPVLVLSRRHCDADVGHTLPEGKKAHKSWGSSLFSASGHSCRHFRCCRYYHGHSPVTATTF